MHTNRVDELQRSLIAAEARVEELETQLARRRTPVSPEVQQAIAAARAAGQTIAEMPANIIDAALDKTDPTQVDLIKVLKSTESEK